MATGVIVFDGDDTLWETEPLYDSARAAAAELVRSSGLDGDEYERIQRQLDVDNVAIYGLTPKRFPTSCVEAYRMLAQSQGRSPDPEAEGSIRSIATAVFDTVAPVYPAARATLSLLGAQHRLGLLTKGDLEVQQRRVADSGLAGFFEAISIVEEKDRRSFVELGTLMHADLGASWSIGNSYRSDIEPAIGLGMRAVWIDRHVWEHERHENIQRVLPEDVFRAGDLAEVPHIIARSASLVAPA